MAQYVIYPTIDSFMRFTQPDLNFGANVSESLGVNYFGAGKTILDRPIANFDVSALAALTINAAQLEIQLVLSGTGGWLAHIERCTRPAAWTELGVTWNKYDGATAWTTAGGDYDTVTPGEVNFNVPAQSGLLVITGLKAYVDDAIALRSNILSLILKADNENPGVAQQATWNSRDASSKGWLLRVDTPGGRRFNMRNYW
jgi:hypothetical protein